VADLRQKNYREGAADCHRGTELLGGSGTERCPASCLVWGDKSDVERGEGNFQRENLLGGQSVARGTLSGGFLVEKGERLNNKKIGYERPGD